MYLSSLLPTDKFFFITLLTSGCWWGWWCPLQMVVIGFHCTFWETFSKDIFQFDLFLSLYSKNKNSKMASKVCAWWFSKNIHIIFSKSVSLWMAEIWRKIMLLGMKKEFSPWHKHSFKWLDILSKKTHSILQKYMNARSWLPVEGWVLLC